MNPEDGESPQCWLDGYEQVTKKEATVAATDREAWGIACLSVPFAAEAKRIGIVSNQPKSSGRTPNGGGADAPNAALRRSFRFIS